MAQAKLVEGLGGNGWQSLHDVERAISFMHNDAPFLTVERPIGEKRGSVVYLTIPESLGQDREGMLGALEKFLRSNQDPPEFSTSDDFTIEVPAKTQSGRDNFLKLASVMKHSIRVPDGSHVALLAEGGVDQQTVPLGHSGTVTGRSVNDFAEFAAGRRLARDVIRVNQAVLGKC